MTIHCAVLGSPIEHSLSPVLHRAAYDSLGLDWRYEAIECTHRELPDLMSTFDDSWRGLSLTMPLKETVLPLLDEIDPVAAECRSVNTVLLAAGMRRGWNTDVAGFIGAWQEAGIGVPRHVVILGAGATARSAAAALAQFGAEQVSVVARRPEPAAEVLALLPDAEGAVVDWLATAAVIDAQHTADLVISTVPPTVAVPVPKETATTVLFDVGYHPWPTPVARDWYAGGGEVVGGLQLLLHQAYVQVELMTGLPAPRAAMRQAGLAALGR